MVNDDSDFGPLTPAALSLGLDSFDPLDEVDEINWLHRYLSSQITSFLAIRSPTGVRNLVYNLVSTLQVSQFKGVLFQALSRFIKKHPYDVAFVVVAAVLAAADEIVYTPSGATGMIQKPFPLELKVMTEPVIGVIVQGWKASAGGVAAAAAGIELLRGGGLAVGVRVPGSAAERPISREEPSTLHQMVGPEELAAGGGRFKGRL